MTPGRKRLARLLTLGVLAACGPSASPPTIPPTAAPASTPSAAATFAPSAAVLTGAPGTSPGTGATVVIDPALLEILPASVGGLEVVESPEGESAARGDPLLARVASAMAAGFALDPASGDFVYAVVVRTVPGSMDAATFRDWRDSYDEGACAQASGVAGNAETEIGGRTVYIGTCTGGLRTYHVWLAERGMLISASAIGERRLGELLVENLRP